MKLMLSVAEAADALDISTSTAYALIGTGDFPVPVRKVGGRLKVSRLQLERWAEGVDLTAVDGAA